jgi:hypothetical protein
MKRFSLIILSFFSVLSSFSQTWSGDVAKIMYGNCTSCHRPGGIAPFSLTTYEDVSAMANWIEQTIVAGDMPPWTPDPEYKNFVHERVLPAADVQTFQNWVSAGTPSGDLRFAPPIPDYGSGSEIGTPDLSLSIGNYTVANNGDVYRNFELPSGLSSAVFANAIEVIPGNSSIVHHVLVFIDSTSNPINPSSIGGTGSAASQFIYSWTPGASPYYTPVGTGFRLAANTRVILQIHYGPGSLGQIDNTQINFKLSTAPQRKIFANALLDNTNMTNGPLVIGAEQIRTFNQEMNINGNWTALYVFPHMHMLGKSIRAWGNLPVSNDTVQLINIPEWDFHWQGNYVFPNSVLIPNGTTLKAEAIYDNTSSNPSNPSSPPQLVTFGEGTYDEMMLVFFAYLPYQLNDQYLIIDKRIIPRGATTFCEGQSVLLETIKGVGYTYQWSKDGIPISGETSAELIATQSGSYTVSISLGPNNAISDPVVVTVSPLPNAIISSSSGTVIPEAGTLLLEASTGSGYMYQWYLNGYAIPGANSSSYETPYNGDYILEVYNGCYNISETFTLTGGIAENPENLKSDYSFYPNPVDEIAYMIIPSTIMGGMVRCTDLTGKLVFEQIISGDELKLDLGNLKVGMYVVSVVDNSGSILWKKKFIRQSK